MRNLVILLLCAISSLPTTASEVGAKAVFEGTTHLEVSPTVGPPRQDRRPGSRPVPPTLARNPPAGEAASGDGAAAGGAEPFPIAVRYCLRRVDGTGRILGEAPLGAEFRSGDRVQLTVESNREGLLAIVHHGSDGQVGLLYPPSTGDLAAAPIEARSPVVMPSPRHSFTFDATPGTERLWLVLARDRAELAALPLSLEMDGADLAVLQLLVDRETGAKNLVVESLNDPGDACTYAANVTGRIVVQEIALTHR